MIRRLPLLPFAITFLVTFYALLVGGTFNGVLDPAVKLISTVFVTLGGVIWLVARTRAGWDWRRTPLDAVMLVWIAAIALAFLANLDSWRRIALGIWYITFYIAVWYCLADLIAHRALRRETLIDAFLLVGVIVLLFGWLQVLNNLSGGLVRPVSVFGNSNSLAGVLVVLLPFIFERIGTHNRLSRAAMTIYAVFGVLLLLLTFSRGAWIGLAAGIAARIALFIVERDLLHPQARAEFWHQLTTTARAALRVGALIAVLALIGAALFLISTFSIGGRGLDLRTFLYETAFTMFSEQPITGHGLFTFGEGLSRLNSIPPVEPHSHAHSLPFGIAAELGLVGLAAFVLTLIVIVRQFRLNTNRLEARDKRVFRAGVASLTAFGVHHLFDLPAMMPALFIALLIVLAVTILPASASAVRRSPVQLVLAAAITALLLTGWFGALTYRAYTGTLRGVTVENAAVRAAQLQSVIDLDPAMPVYHQQQGYLYSVAGDDMRAAAAFERYTSLAPQYTAGWANLALSYARLGRYADAVSALETAAALAPGWGGYTYPLERYRTAAETGVMPALPPLRDADPFASDVPLSENINPIQFLRLALPRQFLPELRMVPEG